MKAIWWVVILATLGVCWAIGRLVRYPGGWAYAFHEEHHKERQVLKEARKAVRELRGAARRETWQAWAALKQAQWTYRRRVRRAESELEQLRTPHRGACINQLGQIALHEHSVLIGDDELPLAGTHVRFELAHSKHVAYVYLRQPDGQERMEPYQGGEFPEDVVRQFTTQIHNAAVTAHRLQDRRAGDIRTREEELRVAQEATEPIAMAQERLDTTRAHYRADLKLPHARAALDDARIRWQDLTGRSPL